MRPSAPTPLVLLEAVGRIVDHDTLLDVLHEITSTACHMLGFERVRFYLAVPGETTLRLEAAGTDADQCIGSSVPLQPSSILGRATLEATGPAIVRMQSPTDQEETTQGLSTCLAPMAHRENSLGVLVADYPQTAREVSQEAADLLYALSRLSAATVERVHEDGNRNRLVSGVSHELRLPLTSITAFCEMLSDGDAGPLNEKQLHFLERINTGAQQLLAIAMF